MKNSYRPYIIKVANQCISGPFVTTGGNDLLHDLPTATTINQTAARSCVITKICAYNVTGANVTLSFGTLDRNPGGAAFVQMLPLLVAVNGFDTEWAELELPAVEFISWPQLTAAGRTGDIYVLASAAAVQVSIEVKEFGQ
jgi:hypothetical protein